jgi:hypothetical protein
MPDGSILSLRAPVLAEAGEYIDRCQQAFSLSSNFRNTWERERLLFLPDAAPFTFTNQTPGQRDRATTVDTYPQYAARVHATFLFGAIFNGDGDFFKVTASGHDGAESEAVRSWAAAYRDKLGEILLDPSVGLYDQAYAMMLERAVFGNGRLYAGDRPGALPIVRCSPMRDSAWEAGNGHDPDTNWWKQSLSAAEWAKKFPNKALGERVATAADNAHRRNEQFTFIHGVMENPDWNPMQMDQVPHKRRWLSIWLNESDKVLVNAAWLSSDPYTAFRGRRRANEMYGREGGDEALEEAQMVQRVRVAVIRSMEKAIDPLMLLPDDGVLTPPTNEPQGAMVVKSELMARAGDPIRYLKGEGRPDLGQEFLRDNCYASIDRAFSRDLMTLPREPRMLDSQIIGLQEEASRGIVPILAPLFAPMGRFIGRIADVAQRAGRLPKPPREAHGLTLSIEFKNPLEKAARLGEVRAFMQLLSILTQASQIDPGARHAVKVIEGVQHCARVLGVPDKLITSAKELKGLLDADAQQAQQRTMLDGMKDGTTALKNLGAGARGFIQPAEVGGDQLAQAA